MPSFGFSWQWITVITMTKYFEDFQEPAGHLYPSSDVRRFVPTLQPDKKLPFIWHSLHSGPMVHFIKNQESQLFDLGFEEEALQRALPPSTAHPFLFLAGMGGAGYSCPATALGGILAQLGVGGEQEGHWHRRAGKPLHLLVPQNWEAVFGSQAGHVNDVSSKQRRGPKPGVGKIRGCQRAFCCSWVGVGSTGDSSC